MVDCPEHGPHQSPDSSTTFTTMMGRKSSHTRPKSNVPGGFMHKKRPRPVRQSTAFLIVVKTFFEGTSGMKSMTYILTPCSVELFFPHELIVRSASVEWRWQDSRANVAQRNAPDAALQLFLYMVSVGIIALQRF